jgi:hypothetical protein
MAPNLSRRCAGGRSSDGGGALVTVGAENPATGPAATPATVLGLEGLGDLRIDQPVPAGASWSERGAQTGEACRTVTPPEYPGVYAIVADGSVRRITLGQRST